MTFRDLFKRGKEGFRRVRQKLENHSEKAERQNKRIIIEEVLAEFEKARKGGGSGLYLVRLSEEAIEYIESHLKSEIKKIKDAEFLKSLPNVPWQPPKKKDQ